MPFCRECFYNLQQLPAGPCPECGRGFDPDDASTHLKTIRRVSIFHVLFGGGVLIFMVAACLLLGGRLVVYVDIPSIVFMVGVLFGGLTMSYGFVQPSRAVFDVFSLRPYRDPERVAMSIRVLDRAGHLAWGAGVVGFFIGAVAMLSDLSDPHSIGAGLAVSLLTALYGAMLAEFLFFPLSESLANRSGLSEQAMPAGLRRVGRAGRVGGAVLVVGGVMLMLVLLFVFK